MAAYNDIAEVLKYIVKVANSQSSNSRTLLHMNEYINLDRRFGLSTKFDSMLEFEGLGKRLTWDKLLEGRLSMIKARANFGKSVELEACAKRLRKEREFAVFVALRRLLGQDDFATALGPEDEQAYSSWRVATGEHLYLFVDSLDEAALGHEEGLQVALRRVTRAVNWPNSNVTWVLSSRPATLTPEVLKLLQTELRTTLYTGKTPESDETADDAREVFTERKQTEQPELADAGAIGRNGAAASSAEATTHKVDPLKVYDLLPLDSSAARLYLCGRHNVADPKEMLAAARRFGLGGLTAGPGSLDVLVFADLVGNPPDNLTDAFDRMVRGVHAQERADRRERQVGNPSPESLATAVEKLASASVVCQLPNIELSQEALEFREGVLSSRPVVGALLAQDSLNYLLSSRLFIDSGHHQVKVYPDELLPYLAAKRLAARVQSPDDAARLLSNFTWSASTGECGVHRVYLPLAGWLSTLSSHCRHELMTIEPQAVAFFGDLRSPQTSLTEAAEALTAAIERLVNVGDVLGRGHYTLTIENFWQVGKPGIADTLRLLFERHADDWRARDTLLDIATYVRLDLFREGVMKTHGWSYASLLKSHDDLHYIMSLERDDDGTALAQALVAAPDVAEQVASTLLTRLAWKWLDSREMAEVAARQFLRGRGAFHIDWALTREVADEAEPYNLYALTRSLLVRVARSLRAERPDGGGRRQGHEFVELVMDMLALAIERSAYSPLRLSRLCLVLHRLVRDFHQGTADRHKLRSALEKATDVRRLFLRGLIEGTDRSSDAIWRSVFLYGTFVVWVDGDDTAIAEPGFTAMVAELKARAAKPPPPEPPRSQRGQHLDKKSKSQLLAVIDGLRDASNENALAWVAGWLAQTIHNSRYGECDFSVLAAQAGDALAAAVRSGLSATWRERAPRWDEDQPNSTYQITIAGLQGLHLDLGDGSALPFLSEQEVAQAIRYARFEINGYPKWFWPVVRARVSVALDEFRSVLGSAIVGAVSAEKAETLIRHLDEAPAAIQSGLAGEAWAYVVGSAKAQEYATDAALTVATTRGGEVDQPTFERVAWSRITAAFDRELPELGDVPLAMTAEEANARQELEAAYKEHSRLRANATVWGLFWLWHFPDSFGRDWEAWRASNRRAVEFHAILTHHFHPIVTHPYTSLKGSRCGYLLGLGLLLGLGRLS